MSKKQGFGFWFNNINAKTRKIAIFQNLFCIMIYWSFGVFAKNAKKSAPVSWLILKNFLFNKRYFIEFRVEQSTKIQGPKTMNPACIIYRPISFDLASLIFALASIVLCLVALVLCLVALVLCLVALVLCLVALVLCLCACVLRLDIARGILVSLIFGRVQGALWGDSAARLFLSYIYRRLCGLNSELRKIGQARKTDQKISNKNKSLWTRRAAIRVLSGFLVACAKIFKNSFCCKNKCLRCFGHV